MADTSPAPPRSLDRPFFSERTQLRRARKLALRVLGRGDRARLLYESCGFQVEGVLRGEFHLGGRYVDDVLMARDLTAR